MRCMHKFRYTSSLFKHRRIVHGWNVRSNDEDTPLPPTLESDLPPTYMASREKHLKKMEKHAQIAVDTDAIVPHPVSSARAAGTFLSNEWAHAFDLDKHSVLGLLDLLPSIPGGPLDLSALEMPQTPAPSSSLLTSSPPPGALRLSVRTTWHPASTRPNRVPPPCPRCLQWNSPISSSQAPRGRSPDASSSPRVLLPPY